MLLLCWNQQKAFQPMPFWNKIFLWEPPKKKQLWSQLRQLDPCRLCQKPSTCCGKPNWWIGMELPGLENQEIPKGFGNTVDGRNPANQFGLWFRTHYLQGFYTSQVVQDFVHQQYGRWSFAFICRVRFLKWYWIQTFCHGRAGQPQSNKWLEVFPPPSSGESRV